VRLRRLKYILPFFSTLVKNIYHSSRALWSFSCSFHISFLTMTLQTTGIALIAFVYFLIRYLNRSDTPKIKNLPEIPGVPLFGNLLQFGDKHAKVAGQLAKKYGPVFQVRLGNRVSIPDHSERISRLTAENSGLYLPIHLTLSAIFGSPINQL